MCTVSLVTGWSTPATADGPFSNTTVDATTTVGLYTSVQLNSSGFPVISYYNSNNGDLKLAVCDNAACTSKTITTIDNAGTTGLYTSLQLNSVGNPVISYYYQGGHDLKLAVCDNPTCTSKTITTVDNSGSVGLFTSLQLDGSDVPVISYYDQTNADLKLAVCNDTDCSSPAIVTVDSSDIVGQYTSMQLDSSGNAVISYNDLSNKDLKLAVCNDSACSSPTLTTVDASGVVGRYTSLQLNSLGNPVISYYDVSTKNLELAVCNDAVCGSSTLTDVDSAGDVGQFTSLQLNSSGNPVISYYDVTNGNLKVAVCNDATCTSTTIVTADSTGDTGQYTSLQLNGSGLPVISYYDVTNASLRLAYIPTTTATINVYAGVTASAPPTPDQPSDAAGDSVPAASAKLGYPTNIAFDASGNMYFTDRYNHTVRMVEANGGNVTTIAGTPGTRCRPTTGPCGDNGPASDALLRTPWGIAVDGATPPNIYVSDYGNQKIRKIEANIDPGAGTITTIAGTGVAGYNGDGISAVTAQVNFPAGITVDASGSILFADQNNNRIRKIDSSGDITTFLGDGTAGASAASCSTIASPCTLNKPTDVKVKGSSSIPPVLSDTEFFIADRGNNTILMTSDGGGAGIVADRIGAGSRGYVNGNMTTTRFRGPTSLAYDALKQQLYIADSANLRVRRFDILNGATTTIAGDGTGKRSNLTSYVAPTNTGGSATATAINYPVGVAFLPSGSQAQGNAYIAVQYENQIRKLTIS